MWLSTYSVWQQNLPEEEDYNNICRNEKGTKFRERALESFNRANGNLVTPAQMCFLRFSGEINFS